MSRPTKSRSHKYGIADLEELAHEKTAELSARSDQDLQLQWPPRETRKGKECDSEFRDWEIECFLLAYHKYKLFDLKVRKGGPTTNCPDGCWRVNFEGELWPLKSKGNPYTHEFLDAYRPPLAKLYSHEYLTQGSAAGELAENYGQPADRLFFEAPLVRDASAGIQSRAYAIDAALFDGSRPPYGSGKPVIGIPVKVTSEDHRALVRDLLRCGGLLNDCSNHGNCKWICQNQTVRYLWVRSQDESDLFEVQRKDDGGFTLKQINDRRDAKNSFTTALVMISNNKQISKDL
jgi:hypothetical protein